MGVGQTIPPQTGGIEYLSLRGKKRGMRTGYTTGACATAATRAAMLALLCGEGACPFKGRYLEKDGGSSVGAEGGGKPCPYGACPCGWGGWLPKEKEVNGLPGRGQAHAPTDSQMSVTITLPVGEQATFAIHRCEQHADGSVTASVIKDAGDDPDVTHGAELCSTVSWRLTPGIEIDGGVGVGRVTKPGLGLDIGVAAINPVPRAMITQVVQEILNERAETRGVSVVISVPDGLERAQKTLNARLGIIGGLSILGTTGIVRPYSTAAYKASISKAVDVAIACGCQQHIVLTTGSRSEKFARRYVSLPDEAYIQMGEFTGHALRDCAGKSVSQVTLVGMIGKLSKIGDGRMQTHVAGAEVNLQQLAEVAQACGAAAEVVEQVRQANTARHFQELMLAHDLLIVFNVICERARKAAQAYIHGKVAIDVMLCDFDGSLLGYAGEHDVSR